MSAIPADQASSDIHNRVEFPDSTLARALFGEQGAHLKIIEAQAGVRIRSRGSSVTIDGDPWEIQLVRRLLMELYDLLTEGYPIFPQDVEYAHRILAGNNEIRLKEIFLDTVYIASNKRIITPKSMNQKAYIEAIRSKGHRLRDWSGRDGKDVPGHGHGRGPN